MLVKGAEGGWVWIALVGVISDWTYRRQVPFFRPLENLMPKSLSSGSPSEAVGPRKHATKNLCLRPTRWGHTHNSKERLRELGRLSVEKGRPRGLNSSLRPPAEDGAGLGTRRDEEQWARAAARGV